MCLVGATLITLYLDLANISTLSQDPHVYFGGFSLAISLCGVLLMAWNDKETVNMLIARGVKCALAPYCPSLWTRPRGYRGNLSP